MVTRSRVGTTHPNPRYASHVSTISPLPRSYKEAFNDFNWRNAMFDEYNALIKNKTWTSVPWPKGANIVRCDLSMVMDTAILVYFYVEDICSQTASSDLCYNQDKSFSFYIASRKYAMEILERAHMVGLLKSYSDSCFSSKSHMSLDHILLVYVVQHVCLYMHDPREPHFSALKRILRYVQGTLDYGLQLFSSTTDSLIAYSDADWAPMLSHSSAEAEYHGVANAVAETCWIRNLLRELRTPLSSDTIVYCDNVSVVYLSSNPVQHHRTKHIEIDIHFVRDLVATGQVRVLHVPSRF
ncbi:ribonuclease H-like domain-containing protein [Tanacetum coccineum]